MLEELQARTSHFCPEEQPTSQRILALLQEMGSAQESAVLKSNPSIMVGMYECAV
jgi:hypothetical protein